MKKAQVTMFIIMGILIVSALLVFFLWVQPTYFGEGAGVKGFEGCVEDAVRDGIEQLEVQAGVIDPMFTYSYMGEEITYLCYTSDYYVTCTVQVPFLKNTFDESLEELIRDEVDACYDASLDTLRAQGYEVVSGGVDYDVVMGSGAVRVDINAPTSVAGSSFAKFNVNVDSPVYDMTMIATSILQFETKYGDSDVSTLMVYHPEYYIEKVKRGDGTTVYIIEHKEYGNKFKFASRSLVWPAGYDIQ